MSGSDRFQRLQGAPVTMGMLIVFTALFFLGSSHREGREPVEPMFWLVPAAVHDGQVWRLLSHALFHANLLHLGVNCWSLLNLGPFLEREFGGPRFFLLFAIAALTGGVAATLVLDPMQPALGASGGLFGLIGAVVAIQARLGRYPTEFLTWPSGQAILQCLITNVVIGFMFPVICQSAHMGGLLGGFLLTWLFLRPGRARLATAWSRALRLGWVALLVAAVFYCTHPFLDAGWLVRQLNDCQATHIDGLARAAVAAGARRDAVDWIATHRRHQLVGGTAELPDLTPAISDELARFGLEAPGPRSGRRR